MKYFVLLGFAFAFYSCNTYITQASVPLRLNILYQKDEFKETENISLLGKMIATQKDYPSFIVSIKINKQIAPADNQYLKLQFDLHHNKPVEKTFFLQIDSTKYKVEFDSIQYLNDETVETETYTDSDGSSSTTTTRSPKKSVVLLSNIPDSIKNAILTSDLLNIRFYIDERPYDLTFHAHPKYRISQKKFSSGSYTYFTEYFSRATSKSRPIELMLTKELFRMNSKADFENYNTRYTQIDPHSIHR